MFVWYNSVCYSTDGECIIAAGNTKYVCIYEVNQVLIFIIIIIIIIIIIYYYL